jgi:N-dimethylarginine dimethylaminohydrolase
MTRHKTDVVETLAELRFLLGRLSPTQRPPMRRVLMVSPDHFRIAYAINPYMKTAAGELQQIDPIAAKAQWDALRGAYRQLGFTVEMLPGHPELPDMVFAANQSFVGWNPETKRPLAVMGRLQSEYRRPEVPLFQQWFESKGYEIHTVGKETSTFEGNGDALLDPSRDFVWGASGPRTTPDVYEDLSRRTGLPVARLTLRAPEFYHLDTCFSILSADTVAIQPMAFDQQNLRMIHEAFDNVIEIDFDENVRYFAANCHSPDGKHVLLNKGPKRFTREIERKGFTPVELDTTEFIKSGGSVFCLKMMVY